MKAVVNTTPLVALGQIGRLGILRQLFDEVIIPEVVYQESIAGGEGSPGTEEIQHATWLIRHTLPDETGWQTSLFGLDPGERDVLRLAGIVQPDWVIIDEKLGRRVAKALGFPIRGTLGILLAAYQANHIDRHEALLAVSQLEKSTVRISQPLIQWFQSQL